MLDITDDGWTDARVELLKTIFETGSDGWLANEINRRTGSSFTRNSIVGKRERLKLFRSKEYKGEYHRLDCKPGRQKNMGEPRRGKHPKRIFRDDFKKGVPLPADMDGIQKIEAAPPPPDFLGITIWELTAETCRYPRGSESILYCGQPVKETSSYCAHCHSLCYQTETPFQRRLREKSGDFLIRRVS